MAIEIIRTVPIPDLSGTPRELQFCVGDVTDTGDGELVDLLALSAFRDDYSTHTPTVVTSLHRIGIDVGAEACGKARDWRDTWQCWISSEFSSAQRIRRLVCFEHGDHPDPAALVGNLFRAISEFALEDRKRSLGLVRLPMLATGDQEAPRQMMLEAIVREAYVHLKLGLPVKRLQVVLFRGSAHLHTLLFEAGRYAMRIESEWAERIGSRDTTPEYDFFVSYRHRDQEALLERLLAELKRRSDRPKVFLDRNDLVPGHFWKPQLLRGMVLARRALCLISDEYPNSPECMDEFHAALCLGRHRGAFLVPLLGLQQKSETTLPLSVRSVHFLDARCPPKEVARVAEEVLLAVRGAG